MSDITDKIDKFGHCVCCGNNLLTKRIVDGKVVDMFLPIYDETIFLLDNGSQMQITICKLCKASNDLSDPIIHENIMQAVQKGWELESKQLIDNNSWTQEQGNKYLNDMSKLNINCNSEKLDKYAIQKKVIELRNLKIEELSVKEEISIVTDSIA